MCVGDSSATTRHEPAPAWMTSPIANQPVWTRTSSSASPERSTTSTRATEAAFSGIPRSSTGTPPSSSAETTQTRADAGAGEGRGWRSERHALTPPGPTFRSAVWERSPGLVFPGRSGTHRAAIGRSPRTHPVTASRAAKLRQGAADCRGDHRLVVVGFECGAGAKAWCSCRSRNERQRAHFLPLRRSPEAARTSPRPAGRGACRLTS